MSNTFLKRLNKEIQLYEKENWIFPNLILKPSDNLSTWYFIVYNLKDTEYSGGIYLGQVDLPSKYPFAPPDFKFLTPSGRFQINTKLCTSFTSYHKELYNPVWNISSMLCGLISFMTDDSSKIESKGIGGIISTKEYTQEIAKESFNYIKNNKRCKEIFDNYFKDYFN